MNKLLRLKEAKEQMIEELRDKVKRREGAIPVIKEKIAHYSKTGNTRKLDIYQRKLDDARPSIKRLLRIIKKNEQEVRGMPV